MLADLTDIQAPLLWQQAQWQSFCQMMSAERLPHGLLLTGPEGVGKSRFALAMAHRLLCLNPSQEQACGACKGCQLNRAGSHPDLYLAEPEAEGKIIRVDQIRAVVEVVAKTSQLGGYRVVVLCPAEAMNVNAANALLKSLEEPGAETVLILVSHQSSGVLPTIRSRCQVLSFCLPPREQACDWLARFTEDRRRSEHVLNVANGAPIRALALCDSDWLGERAKVLQQWLSVLQG